MSVCSGDDRVLTEEEVKRITINQKSFIDLIKPEIIVPKLLSLDVITTRHGNAILCKENDAEKNRKLIEIIKRRSYRDIQSFCSVLTEHNMEYLAKAVQGVGVISILHAKQEGPSAKKMIRTELHQHEADICASVNRSLNETISTEDLENYQHCRDITKLRDRGITMVNVSPTGSIAVYILCSSQHAVRDHWDMLQTGVQRRYLETIFAGCSKIKDFAISLTVNPEDCSLMFHYPWALDDSYETDSLDSSLDLTPNVELADILEMVRDKKLTLEEAERWIKENKDSVEMDVGQPSIKRPLICQPSLGQKPNLIATCRSNSAFVTDSLTASWQNVISDGSFRFLDSHNSPVFGGGLQSMKFTEITDSVHGE